MLDFVRSPVHLPYRYAVHADGGFAAESGGRPPRVSSAALRGAVVLTQLPGGGCLSAAAYCHQGRAAHPHGHRLHPLHRALSQAALRLLRRQRPVSAWSIFLRAHLIESDMNNLITKSILCDYTSITGQKDIDTNCIDHFLNTDIIRPFTLLDPQSPQFCSSSPFNWVFQVDYLWNDFRIWKTLQCVYNFLGRLLLNIFWLWCTSSCSRLLFWFTDAKWSGPPGLIFCGKCR